MSSWHEKLLGGFKRTSDRLIGNLTGLGTGPLDNATLDEIEEALIASDLGPATAARIRDRLATGTFERNLEELGIRLIVAEEIEKALEPVARPIEISAFPRPHVILVIGVNGSGKTTTIAKLASRAKVHQRRKVGLITLDTFRIGAVDQLKQYAEIFKVPVQVVQDPAELEQAVGAARKAGDELVFIDSAGRSHRDELKMSELSEFLAVVPEAEVHLVLSTTTHLKTVGNIAERFAPVGFDRVILTKLDESVALGPLIGALVDIGVPISYVTDGQNVPKDIVPADPDRLVDIVMKPPVS